MCLFEYFFELCDIINLNVSGKNIFVGGECPGMDVMNILDSRY